MDDFSDNKSLLVSQVEYYRARANEYDEWFLRQGRYDHGPQLNGQWFGEVDVVRDALRAFNPAGDVLELACGTGLWTEQLLPYAGSITAVDAAPEVLDINRDRLQSSAVRYVQANVFDWQPQQQYDVVFFSFWLSHVPLPQFAAFWRLVGAALKPGGRWFFVDSRYDQSSTAKDHQLAGKEDTTITRRLNDGRVFRIVKVFYEARRLAAQLRELGWQAQIGETEHYFIYGDGQNSVLSYEEGN